MIDQNQNPRESIGANFPPEALARAISVEANFPPLVLAFLEDEYANVPTRVTELLDQARALPTTVDDDDVMGRYAKLIKELRDEAGKIEAFRVKETEPYLRGKQAVDNFFFTQAEKCQRRDRKAKLGALDVLQARLDDYNQRKLAAEQERRRQEELKARREADARAAVEEAARRKAEEDRLAADRARKPETTAVKTTIANQSEQAAATALAESALAASKAEQAHIETLARPADMVRTRVEEGPTVTMATEPYAVVEDETKLDMAKLWPFIALDAKEKAVRAWAKTTGHNQQMAGAKIGRRPKTVVR